ncbi:MAG: hypothetical protein A2143_02500 [Gallionellales bacterium RBG_16_57_15]|nr:MAG: hypothetical protein A2143_02500 [Gallionellales bacterium RBG_16_57_15]
MYNIDSNLDGDKKMRAWASMFAAFPFFDHVSVAKRTAKSVLWLGLMLLVFPIMVWCEETKGVDDQEFNGDWGQYFHGNLIIQLTNQSYHVDPVDFSVYLDGKLVLEKDLPYLSGRYIETLALQVPPGKHRVMIETKKGTAKISRTVTVKEPIFVVAFYWYYTDKDLYGPVKRHIEIKTSPTPLPQE